MPWLQLTRRRHAVLTSDSDVDGEAGAGAVDLAAACAAPAPDIDSTGRNPLPRLRSQQIARGLLEEKETEQCCSNCGGESQHYP